MPYGTVAIETALTHQWGLTALVKQVGAYGWVARDCEIVVRSQQQEGCRGQEAGLS